MICGWQCVAAAMIRGGDTMRQLVLTDALAVAVDVNDAQSFAREVYSDNVPKLDHVFIFFFSSRRRHTRFDCDWSSDVCSSDLRASPRLERQSRAGVERASPDSPGAGGSVAAGVLRAVEGRVGGLDYLAGLGAAGDRKSVV